MNEFKVLASVKRTLNRNASGCFLRLLNPFSVEMSMRFCERNSKYITALDALDPGSENFMDEGKVKPLLDLMNNEMIESQFTVARQFWQTFCTGQDKKMTLFKLLSNYFSVFQAKPGVLTALKHALKFGALNAMLFLNVEECIF